MSRAEQSLWIIVKGRVVILNYLSTELPQDTTQLIAFFLFLTEWIIKWCPIMFPPCTVLTPYSSPLTTAHWRNDCPELRGEERRGRGAEWRGGNWQSPVFHSEPQLGHRQPLYSFSCLWLVVDVRLLNKDYQIEKYWTFSNSKGFHTDFVFKNFMWEIRGANKPEPLHFPFTPTTSSIRSPQHQWNVRNVQFCH